MKDQLGHKVRLDRKASRAIEGLRALQAHRVRPESRGHGDHKGQPDLPANEAHRVHVARKGTLRVRPGAAMWAAVG